MVLKLFIHVSLKWVENYYSFLDWVSHVARQKKQRIFNSWNFRKKTTEHFSHLSISHQTAHNKNHYISKFATGLSQQNHPESITQNQSNQKIRKEYHMDNNCHTQWLSTVHENDPKSWRWWYHGNYLTTGQKEIVMEKRVYPKIKLRQRVFCFTFDRRCVVTCIFSRIYSGGTMFLGVYILQHISIGFRNRLSEVYTK